MSIGDIIFGLMGKSDPRSDMLKAIGAQMNTPATPTTYGATAPETPEAYKTPADLMTLYSNLLERQDRNATLQRGLGLIGAGFAKTPEAKQNIMDALGGGGGYGGGGGLDIGGGGGAFNPISMMKNILELQTAQSDLARKAELRASIPDIAKKYNLTPETAKYLFESGSLDELIKEAEKPHDLMEVADAATGQKIIFDKVTHKPITTVGGVKPDETESTIDEGTGQRVLMNKRTGDIIARIGSPKPHETKINENNDGSKDLIDSVTGKVIKQVTLPGNKPTPDMVQWYQINADRAARGDPEIPLEEWLLMEKKAGSAKPDPVETEFGKKAAEKKVDQLFAEADVAKGAINSIGQARQVVNLVNSPNFAGDVTSPMYLDAAKVLSSYLGVSPETQAKITNTEQLQSVLKEQVLPKVKQLGAGTSISNADVRFSNDMVGNIATNPKALQNIAIVSEKGSLNQAIDYNAKIRKEIEARTKRDPKFDPSNMPDLVEIPGASDELKSYIMSSNRIPPEALAALQKEPTPERIKEFDDYYGDGSRVARILLGVYE